MKPVRMADFDLGNSRLILETSGREGAAPDTLTMRGSAGERLSMPLDRAGIVAAAMLAVTPVEAREGAAPWTEGEEPQPVKRFYLGDDDFLRVRKSRAGFVIERGRHDGTIFRPHLMVGIPSDAVGFLVGAMTENDE